MYHLAIDIIRIFHTDMGHIISHMSVALARYLRWYVFMRFTGTNAVL